MCDVRACKSGLPGTVSVNENIGDGCFRVDVCTKCSETLGVPSGHDLPEPHVVARLMRRAARLERQGGG